MHFQHAPEIWSDYPQLVAGAVLATGITTGADVAAQVDSHLATGRARLGSGPESELPEIRAWRRAFTQMGLKPTQYRCASEALLRRLRKEGTLPRIHPLIDLCNAISVAYATPVAALDLARVADRLEVRYATGHERDQTFAGDTEHPDAGEVIFADAAGRAHARRWTNRQSGYSAVRDTTGTVLVVAEAMHESAPADMATLVATLADALAAGWSTTATTAILSAASPRFEVPM
jgi:DNA/RNA-binding domain of Phe-tRNA-synthetase-like protein